MKTVNLYLCRLTLLTSIVISAGSLRAEDPAPTPEDLERLAAIEAFTKKQIEADYGPKFEAAAKEFNVPVEVLMGISFAETRHEHLMWPEGELYSPENGMPRPFGIMSLWDNEIFGHSLRDAAKLIGREPEELKKDPLQNMRGAAALLRKHYEEAEKPKWAKEDSMESWNYAIRKYCGIDDLEFAAQHAFDVYDWLSQGYDQYGIKLPEVPDLDLKEMWEETKQIKDEERKKKEEQWRKEGRMDDVILEEYQGPDGMWYAREAGNVSNSPPREPSDLVKPYKEPVAPKPVVAEVAPKSNNPTLMIILGAIAAAFVSFLMFRKKPAEAAKRK